MQQSQEIQQPEIQQPEIQQPEIQQPEVLMSFGCKVTYTSIFKSITIPGNTTITELINYINNNLRYELNIHDRYRIEVVETFQNSHIHAELAPPLEPTTQTVMERYGSPCTSNGFYLRPIDPEVGRFVRQTNYSI